MKTLDLSSHLLRDKIDREIKCIILPLSKVKTKQVPVWYSEFNKDKQPARVSLRI